MARPFEVPEIRKMIGERLRKARLIANKEIEDASEACGVEKATVFNWEKGNRNVNYEKIITLCNLYNVSADYILGLTDEIRPLIDPKLSILDKEITPEEMPPELQKLLVSLGKLITKAQKEEQQELPPKKRRKKS